MPFRFIPLMILLLLGLPLLGIRLSGKPLDPYLEFPPVTRYVEHAPFSWAAFLGLSLFVAAIIAPFVIRLTHGATSPRIRSRARRSFPMTGNGASMTERSFPSWGWIGLGITGIAWLLAWTRFTWFEDLQPFTFTPLWIGYILVVNAWTWMRTGSCMILDRPRYVLSLFPLSAVFWWFFEYLNRFVQNWYYVGVSELGPAQYVLHATLPFSTVLPAVLGTTELLRSFPHLSNAFRNLWAIRINRPRVLGWVVLMLSTVGLVGVGIWPDYFFPLIWVAPLLLITSFQTVLGQETIFSGIAQGDWRPIWLPALAGLTCGWFWEMWNTHSLVQWEYAVPYVHRFEIFAMPLLGYAGYLPFGLECKVVADLVPSQKTPANFRHLPSRPDQDMLFQA